MRKLIYLSSIAVFACIGANANDVKINGFANLVGGFTSAEDEALYNFQDRFTFDQESLFGIQVSGNINDDTTATAQIVSRGIDDYEPGFAWAYMTHTFSSKSKISVGRVRMPLYKYSASLDVGYSYHWIQPPQGIYGATFDNIEGVRYEYSDFIGDWEYQWQLLAGSFNQETTVVDPADAAARVTFQFEIDDVVSTSLNLQWEWFSFRTSYSRGDVTLNFPPIDPIFDLIEVSGFPGVADLIRANRDEGYFLNFAVDVDMYDWFVGIEYIDTDTENSWLTKARSRFITAGMRFGPFTPHITYSEDRNRSKTFTDALNTIPLTVEVPLGPGGAPIPLRLVTSGLLASFEGQAKYIIVGLRYDFQPNMAFKIDYTEYDDQLTGAEDATLIRLGVNYVF